MLFTEPLYFEILVSSPISGKAHHGLDIGHTFSSFHFTFTIWWKISHLTDYTYTNAISCICTPSIIIKIYFYNQNLFRIFFPSVNEKLYVIGIKFLIFLLYGNLVNCISHAADKTSINICTTVMQANYWTLWRAHINNLKLLDAVVLCSARCTV